MIEEAITWYFDHVSIWLQWLVMVITMLVGFVTDDLYLVVAPLIYIMTFTSLVYGWIYWYHRWGKKKE